MAFQLDPGRQKNCFLRLMHLSYLKDKDSMLNHQGNVFPNFYLCLLPLFANIQSPDYSSILPAFLATSLFLVTFSPFNIFNCPSPSLAVFPLLLLFVILLVFWYNLLLIQGLERIVHVTLVCRFTMHLVSSCRRKGWPHSVFSQAAQSHCFSCVRSVSQLHRSSLIQQKIFLVGLSLQQPNRQT